MSKRLLLALLLLTSSAFATTTVSGNLKDLTGTAVTSSTFVRFYLRGCSGNQPRINGTALIAPTFGNVYYKDFVPNGSGAISGTLYSTRDAAGTGNGEIECGGVFTGVWYGMVVFQNGKAGPETPVHAKNGVTLDVTNVTPISTTPVATAPSGDTTYLRLDAGNSPVTGAVTFNAAVTATNFDNMQVVTSAGSELGATISAACTAAGANGKVKVTVAGGTLTTSPFTGCAASTTVEFGPGVFTFNSAAATNTISVNGIKVRGAGIASTIFEIGSATSDFFSVTGNDFELSGMQIRPASLVTRTAGSVINCQATEIYAEHLKVIDPFNFFSALASSCGKIDIEDVRGDSSGGNWNYFLKTKAASGTVASTHLTNLTVNVSGAATQSDALFVIDSGTDTVYLTSSEIIGKASTNPVFRCIDSLAIGGFPRWIRVTSSSFESSGNTAIDLQNGKDISFVNSYVATATIAFSIGSNANILNTNISNSVITNIQQSAIVTSASGSAQFSILNNRFIDIGLQTTNTYPVIDLSAGVCTNFRIIANESRQISANQPNFGVKFGVFAYANFSVEDNNFTNVAGGGILSGATTITGTNWSNRNNATDGDSVNSPGLTFVNQTADYNISLGGFSSGKGILYTMGNRNMKFDSTGTGIASFQNNGTTKLGITPASGLITTYAGTATAGQGAAVVYGATSQKSETAADTSVLSFTPPAAVGQYRINFSLSLSAANAATLGWTATWTDSNGNAQTPTNLSLFQEGTAAPALTFTTSAAGNYYGSAIVDVNSGAVAIVVKLTFSGTSFTGKVSATIERLQ